MNWLADNKRVMWQTSVINIDTFEIHMPLWVHDRLGIYDASCNHLWVYLQEFFLNFLDICLKKCKRILKCLELGNWKSKISK